VQDTRTEAWLTMLHQFRSNPVFGVGAQDGMLIVQENSLLAIAATSGLFGLIPFGIAIAAIMLTIARLRRARRFLGELALAGDLIGASIIALLVQSVFEATLTGMLVMSVATLYLYLAGASYLLEVARDGMLAPAALAEGSEVELEPNGVPMAAWGEWGGASASVEAFYERGEMADPAYQYDRV
jgi:hypothetical protein